MAYITCSKHSKFEGCRATLNTDTGKASVWIDLEYGRMCFESSEVENLILALHEGLAKAKNLESEGVE